MSEAIMDLIDKLKAGGKQIAEKLKRDGLTAENAMTKNLI